MTPIFAALCNCMYQNKKYPNQILPQTLNIKICSEKVMALLGLASNIEEI